MEEKSKDELISESIYFMCVLAGIEETILREDLFEIMFNNLNKLDYNEVHGLYYVLKTIYKNHYIYYVEKR